MKTSKNTRRPVEVDPNAGRAQSTPKSPRGREAEEIVRAIAQGEVDAVVVHDSGEERVLALANHSAVNELHEMVRAIRNGEVDAFVVSEESGDRVLTLSHIEQALRESEAAQRHANEQLRMALAAAGAGAWERRLGECEPTWSPQYRELFGFTTDEPLGPDSWRQRVHPDDLDRVVASIMALQAPGVTSWREEYRILHPTKGVRWLASRGLVTFDAQGRASSVRGITLDVTERKLMEEELAERRQSLEEQVRERTAELMGAHERLRLADRMAAVGTLAAGLAHDIGNVTMPLSIRMDSLLANQGLDSEVKDELSSVAELLTHLRQMSKNLSLFARDPAQEGSDGRTTPDAWCEQVRGFIGASVSGRGSDGRPVRVDWDVPAGLPDVVVAPHRLTQAVLNLVHNARDAIHEAIARDPANPQWTSDRGVVTVRARKAESGDAVVFMVMDDGCGMDEATRRRCTEIFFTTKDRPNAAGASGSGMGMSIAYAIANRVGGRMEIESELGEGTSVKLYLPVV